MDDQSRIQFKQNLLIIRYFPACISVLTMKIRHFQLYIKSMFVIIK